MPNYYIAFWNVENLFDVVNSPRRSDKLQRTLAGELEGWTQNILDKKIDQLSAVIQFMNNGKGPDILGVCEIENQYVLDLLVKAIDIPGRNYKIIHHDMSDNRGIDVAFIYDDNFFEAERYFSHFIIKRNATRDLFQVNFKTKNSNSLFLIGNHWPSRMGGQYESEPYRIIAAEALAYFHERIREVHNDKNVAVLAMGDFNDEPFSRSLVQYALSEKTRIKVTNAKSPKFLNLMWLLLGQTLGSHYYNNRPNMLDQFLASKGLVTGKSKLKILCDTIEIIRYPAMINKGSYPIPIRFGRGKSLDINGYSDHYPIAVQIKE